VNRSVGAREALLADAADLPEADRERFIVEHCPDLSLRREVLDLPSSAGGPQRHRRRQRVQGGRSARAL
jgi:hypothetical protein